MKQEKRIPTILGVVLLLLSISTGVFLTRMRTSFDTGASGDCQPSNLQITNISDKSVSLFFETTAACISNIKINGSLVNDLRTKTIGWKADQKSTTHYYQVDNLKSNTAYTFQITSGGQTFNRSEYRTKTAQTPSGSAPVSNLAWGKVIDTAKNPAPGVVIFLYIPNASPLSAVTTSSGNWNISLATSFNQNQTDYFDPPSSGAEDIVVISLDSQPTSINNNIANNNPVPDITIGQDFVEQKTAAPTSNNLFNQATGAPLSKKLSIIYPKEGEKIYSLKPEILGTAASNTSVSLKVIATGNYYEVITDSAGNWKWTPPLSFIPGSNSILAQTNTDQITRNFTVEASGGLAFEASNSATVAPTAIPTLMPTTSALTPTLTPVPTVVRTTQPSTDSGVPKPGAGGLSIIFIVISFVSVITSLHLFRK